MKKLVVFTGAGISAESGLQTFRDSDGLWENYRIKDVATPMAWQRNPSLVLDFYNQRRRQIMQSSPHIAHTKLVELEDYFNLQIITQNIDDLHERAGSKNILHLHGEILKARSEVDHRLIYPLKSWEMKPGALNEYGHALRPHIVWFGEPVPQMDPALSHVSRADIFIIIGSSLEVYPAASLVSYAPEDAIKFIIDPNAKEIPGIKNLTVIKEKAGNAVPVLVKSLIKEHV